MKFAATITGWGNDALWFLEDPDSNFVIIFDNTAPPELAEIAVLHTPNAYIADPEVGDIMIIGDKAFDITAVGDEAKQTLKELGHCTLVFTGKSEPDRPGCIMLHGDEPLKISDIYEGAEIEIH